MKKIFTLFIGLAISSFFILLFSNSFSQTTDTYTTNGSWVCPTGVTSVTVECWGGGGAGGGEALSTVFGGGGGAGGAYATKVVTVIPGNSYTVTVGTGSAGANGAGATGNPSWFSLVSEVYAQGGAGGAAANGGTANGGTGSSASSIGTTKYAGGNGANGTASISGGGGGGAGSTGAGGNASGVTAGTGTSLSGGNGGAGDNTPLSESDGLPGSTYGGGGSGAMVSDGTNHAGGSGANGLVKITYSTCSALSIPYSESFESITVANTLPNCMAATNIGSKVYTYIAPTGSYNQAARTGTDFASFKYSCDDWIFTQGLALSSGITYNFSFWYVTDGYSGWTTLNAFFGNAQNSGAMTTAITGATVSGPTNTTYVQMTGTFTPSSTGTFYCGIHCLSNSTPWYLSIDDINITAATPMVYSSCTTTQLNTTSVAPGATAQEIIGIQIVTTGSTSPLSVTQFTVNANGSTAIADINAANSAKIYYTGTSSIFATTTYFGQNTPTIANFVINGSQTLSSGTNYFWLVYDIKAGATIGNVVDGQCTSLNVGGARTPTVTAPAGNRIIALAYCTPAPTSVDGTGITNVTCGTINNTTGDEAGHYGDYTAQVATFMQSTLVTVNITYSTGYTYVTKIWVDWNVDGDFLDPGEEVYSGESLSANPTTLIATFNVPAGASVGNHRMRIGGADTGPPTPCYTGSYGTYEDYTLNVTALPACSGTPTGGTTVTSATPICPGVSVDLSVTGSTVASGLTYQWQSSPDNSVWTNIGGATSSSYSPSLTTTTWYRRKITCTASGLFAYSSSVQVVVTLSATCYCASSATSTSDMDITNITLGTINNTTPTVSLVGSQGTATGTAGMYSNFWGSAVPIPSCMQGVTIPFSVQVGGTAYSHRVDVYIDFNKDGDLIDAGESFAIFAYANPALPNTTNSNITIPITATVGNTLMRVVCVENSASSACGTYTWGETEDYTINIAVAVACSGTPVAGTASASPSAKCASETSTISVSGYTIASGITFQWQWSPQPITTWTNIFGATSFSYTSSASASTNYRCVVTCTNSGLSANSASTLLTVNNCIIIGDGTSSTNFPTPYIGSYEDGRSQYIVTAAELTALGLTPGSVLTSLSFNVATKASTAVYKGFTIEIGHTASSTYSSAAWLTPTFTSCFSANYTVPAAGWNLHTFTSTFTWNGADNIVVQACFNNGAYTSADPVYYTSVSNTVCYAEADAGLAGCNLAAESYGSSRPNMKFNYNPGPPCSGTPSGGTASSSITNFCNTATPVLSLSGYTYATGINFQWQYSTSNSPYSWADITGAQSATYAVNPAINQTRYFRCAVSCGANTAYSTIVTVTNTAQSITGTNSPVTVVCNTAANLTATATGGTISWYANATGGTALATGGSYSPVVTANTTFYCAAGSGGSSSNVGKPSWTPADGYVGISNWGIRFNAISAFTLVSVKVYPETAGTTISVVLQDNTGTPIGSPITFTAGPAGVIQTLTLNMSIPVGNDYRLVTGNSTSLARGSTGMAFPYTLAGVCSLTASEWGGTTTGTYYYFYDWVVSTGCESSPRTPVNVIVSGGVTAPVCCSVPSPAHNATSICPIDAVISWDASTTACRTATGYLLYFGTDAAATNIYNGIDVGLVTSYDLGTLIGSQAYYWRIVPYNTAGNGACATVWKFTTAANPGNICATNMGTGVINVASLPYSSGNGTTKNKVNDITSVNAVSCGSTSYFSGEDQVWIFTPASSGSITINLTSGGTYTGLTLYDGCPLTGITCGAIQGNCIAYSQSSGGTRTMTACVTAGITYYLVLDSYALPDWNAYSDLTISAPSGSVAPNDLPCNATTLTLGVQVNGNNACTGGSSEPATPSCWTTGLLNTIWYSVVCPASGSISIMTTLGTLTNTQIAVYSGSCASLSMVSGACNDNISGCGSGSDASQLMLTGLTPGATYYIRVDGGYDLIGAFSITAIDGNSSFASTPGQDCGVPLPTCNSVLQVSDPGYSGTGSICDFDGTYDCTGGDRAAVFYTIEIAQNGTLAFDIIPNDYCGGLPGDGTDYDYIVWKIAGSGTLATCSSILTNSSTGMMACNYSYIDVTGLYPGGGANPAIVGSGWDAAYEDVITVTAGDIYLLWVSNYSLSTSGFTLDYTGTAAGVINYSPNPTLIAWTGSLSTVWTNTTNWGGCNIPSCLTSAVISSNVPTMPVISSNVTVNDLTIYSGATLTINTGNKLTVCGNFVNNGTVVFNGTSTLEFAGTTPQTFISNNALTITNVIINNAAGVTLAGSAMTVTGTFTLTNGILYTSSSAMLIMNAGSTVLPVAGGSATSFVNGPMQKLGTTAFIFPLGDGTRWRRLGISAPTNSTFQAEYFSSGYGTYNIDPADVTAVELLEVSKIEYWNLSRPFGTGTPQVTLYWEASDANSSYITYCPDLQIAHWDGSNSWWENNNYNAVTVTSTGCNSPLNVSGTIQTNAGISEFSPFTYGSKTSGGSNPFPIELLSFSGKNLGEKNLLEWITSSETNNDYFVLEKSKDGILFEELTKVDGAGTSNSLINYDEIDYDPFEPVTYYKLKQVDFDGMYSYSDIISVSGEMLSDQPVFINLYPNPASTLVNLEVYSPCEGEMKVEIYDYLGMVIVSEKRNVKKGNDIILFDISKFADGIYYSKIFFNDNGFVGYKKFVKE
ncbi:MAG: GEVED domain-containing protein [Bacteroidota bacterium]